MRIGTKSVLFGVHQFLLHPLLIAIGWWKEYGWRRVSIGTGVATHLLDPRLWLAFIVHDLGYLGKPNMDGEEGEAHPEFGARVMRRLFGAVWGDFVLLHSRYYAKRLGLPVSALAMADKWVIVLEPSWLYLPRAWASGELDEYLEVGARRADAWQPTDAVTALEALELGSRRPLMWHRAVKAYMRRWIAEHRDGRQDTWTRRRHGASEATEIPTQAPETQASLDRLAARGVHVNTRGCEPMTSETAEALGALVDAARTMPNPGGGYAIPAQQGDEGAWIAQLRSFALDAKERRTINGTGDHYGIVRMSPDDVLRLCEIASTMSLERRMPEMPNAVRDVLAERERQKAVEGWTEAHDDAHDDESLAQAAACYALPPEFGDTRLGLWPMNWALAWWKPSPANRRRELVKAGALILAEIERLDRGALTVGETR